MSESNPPIPADQQTVKPCRRRFLDEFKRDAVRLITDQQYTFQAAASAVGVSQKSLRDWQQEVRGRRGSCERNGCHRRAIAGGQQAASPAAQAGRDGARDF